MSTIPIPLEKSSFSFDTSGVSGFFGGDEAISAMATVHVYSGRRFLGWYNTPGSYEIAKHYGLIPKSPFFRGLFPGFRTDPAELFEFDGRKGPGFRGGKSGTVMDSTGHLASILMKECASKDGKPISGRTGSKIGVTIAKLNTVPEKVVYPERIFAYSPFLAIIPIFASLASCIACSVYKDWFSFSLILLGVVSNGISCLVIGSGKLCFIHHIPAVGSPPGDGILGSEREFVLLKGEEGAVNSVTLGKFSIEFPNEGAPNPTIPDKPSVELGKGGTVSSITRGRCPIKVSNENYEEWIGCCSILLTIQFVAQLFLIPQGTLFGQIMFTSSLAVSWIYNMGLSIFDREKIQRRILLHEILKNPSLTKYTLTSRTAAVVFMLLILRPEDTKKMLDAYLPNDTKVWKQWKDTVLKRLSQEKPLHFVDSDEELDGYTAAERQLLHQLYGDARSAYDGSRALSQEHTPENRSTVMITPASTDLEKWQKE